MEQGYTGYICGKCQSPISSADSFCQKCGTKIRWGNGKKIYFREYELELPTSRDDTFCEKCGNLLVADDVYCGGCGTKVVAKDNFDPKQNSLEDVAEAINESRAPSPEPAKKSNIAKRVITALIVIGLIVFSYLASCSKVIKYNIGSVDGRFEIGREELVDLAKRGETKWEKAVGKNLFEFDPASDFKINLIYDERQQAIDDSKKLEDELDEIDGALDEFYGSIEGSVERFNSLYDEYQAAEGQYQTRLDRYNRDVNYWNSRGGAPEGVYANLQRERGMLIALQADLNKLNADLQFRAIDLELAPYLEEEFVDAYNSKASELEEAQKPLSQDYELGTYEIDEINIYTFESKTELVNILAHEFGHALGLDHVDSSNSLMHFLIHESATTKDLKISSESINGIQSQCIY